MASAAAGTRLSASIPSGLLLSLFAGLMLVVAAAMLRRGRLRHPSEKPPVPGGAAGPDDLGAVPSRGGAVTVTLDKPAAAVRAPAPPAALLRAGGTTAVRSGLKIAATATGVGLLTGFFGVGGGFVIVPALVLALGFEMPVAVGTSLLVIAINSAAALTARLGSHVHLDWPLLGVFTVAALAGTLAGTASPPASTRPGSPPPSPSCSLPWPRTRLPAACPGWCDRSLRAIWGRRHLAVRGSGP